MKRKIFLLMGLIATILLVTSCSNRGKESARPGRLTIVTTLFPVYDFTRAVAGDRADVSLLLPPGMEPHSFEPKPDDMIRINKAGMFIYTNRYMEPWAADIINGLDNRKIMVVDASKEVLLRRPVDGDGHADSGHHHGEGMDPHIWLDFGNAERMVDNILAGLIVKDPGNSGYYTANAAAYKARLDQLDARYRETLSSCRKKEIVQAGHFAFGYLAARYGLKYEAAYTASADSEPTPAKIASLIGKIRNDGLGYIFSEELMEPRVAQTIAQETGAKILILNGAHNIGRDDLKSGVSFLTIMEKNLENLRAGLQCR